MKKKKPTYEELEERLNQAEETLKAIRSGEIDIIIGEKCPFIVRAKEVEDTLRETQEVLELAISGSNAGLWDLKFNPQEPFQIPDEIYISPPLKAFIGFKEDEFPNSISAWHSRIHPEDLDMVRKIAQEHLEGRREIHEVEYRIYHKDGSLRWIHSRGKILRDEHGVPRRWTGIDWDITEQKKKEDSLRAAEERYGILVEKSLQGLIIVQDFRIVFANQKLAEITGYNVEELLLLPPEKVIGLVHPEDQALVWGRFRKRLEGKDLPPRYEYRGIKKDGSLIWLEMYASLIEYQGRPAIQGAIIDITDRKKTEETLNFERNQLLSIFNSIDQAIYVTDPRSYEVLFVNQHLRQLLGKDPVGGLCYKEFQGLDNPCEFCTNDIILKLKGQPYRWEYYNPILNREFDLTDRIIKWPDGRDVRFEIAIDITERRKMERELRESEEKYRIVVENAGDAIAIAQGEFFKFVNKKMAELLGYSKEELLFRPFLEVVHPEDRAKVLESYSKRLKGEGAPEIYTFRAVDKKGNVRWAEMNAELISYEGKPAVLCLVRDITERMEAEKKIKESQEKLRNLFDYAPVGYHEIDREGRITNVNQRELEMLGYEFEEMVGQFVWKFVVDEEKSRQYVVDKLAGKIPPGESFERLYRRKDSSTFPVLIQDQILKVN